VLFRSFSRGNPLGHVALKVIGIMSHLLLQRPHSKSTCNENKQHLLRRMSLWLAGDIPALLSEARMLHAQFLRRQPRTARPDDLRRRFTNLMLNGKVNAAIRLVTEQGKGRVLSLTTEVHDLLK
jgi:hypothetical protein